MAERSDWLHGFTIVETHYVPGTDKLVAIMVEKDGCRVRLAIAEAWTELGRLEIGGVLVPTAQRDGVEPTRCSFWRSANRCTYPHAHEGQHSWESEHSDGPEDGA